MINVNRDVGSTANFPPNTKTSEFIRQLKATGVPVVLTINGESKLVVEDAASYQKLVEIAERAEELEITRRSLAEADAGLGRPIAEMLAEMRRVLDEKRSR